MNDFLIPVIIGSILLGPISGSFLGLVFGISSLLKATFMPNLSSFAFSPFITDGNFYSLIVSIVPRVCIGIVPYFTVKLLKRVKFFRNNFVSYSIAAFLGSLTNTLLVMNFIYIFFRLHVKFIYNAYVPK